MFKKIIKFLICLLPWFLSSIICNNYSFFNEINTPSFTIPRFLFGIVWPILYILIATSIYMINNYNKSYKKDLLYNYIFNQLYTIVFFCFKSTLLGFVVCLFTLLTSLFLYYETKEINKLSSKLLIPLQPKKIKFTDITSQNSSNLNYIINKVKVFLPSVTSIKNTSSLIIPQQPKKTSFIEITPNKASNILYDIPPKKKLFNEIAIESIPDIFIPEQPKKRYYSAMNAETMTIHASERPEFCLEIDPNEEIFIPNVYDMLLIQNYWDDLSIKSFRVCLRPKGYIGKSSQNLDMFNKNGNEDRRDNNVEEIKESDESQSQEDNEKDKDVLKDFSENYKEDKDEKNKVDNIYEDRVSNRSNNSKSDKSNKSNISNKSNNSNNSNKADINKEKKHKEKAIKGHRFRDLKKKIMMLQDD